MLNFAKSIGYRLLALFLLVLSLPLAGLLWLTDVSYYLYSWLPNTPTGDRIFFFLDDLCLDIGETIYYLWEDCFVASACFFWLAAFPEGKMDDAAEMTEE